MKAYICAGKPKISDTDTYVNDCQIYNFTENDNEALVLSSDIGLTQSQAKPQY